MSPAQILLTEIVDWLPTLLFVGTLAAFVYAWKLRR